MRQTYGGVGFIDVLTACPRRTKGVFANVLLIDVDLINFVDFRHHSDGTGRGMHSALGFGFRHPLHSMRAGFKLQLAINILAFNARDDFLEATMFAGAAALLATVRRAAA